MSSDILTGLPNEPDFRGISQAKFSQRITRELIRLKRPFEATACLKDLEKAIRVDPELQADIWFNESLAVGCRVGTILLLRYNLLGLFAGGKNPILQHWAEMCCNYSDVFERLLIFRYGGSGGPRDWIVCERPPSIGPYMSIPLNSGRIYVRPFSYWKKENHAKP